MYAAFSSSVSELSGSSPVARSQGDPLQKPFIGQFFLTHGQYSHHSESSTGSLPCPCPLVRGTQLLYPGADRYQLLMPPLLDFSLPVAWPCPHHPTSPQNPPSPILVPCLSCQPHSPGFHPQLVLAALGLQPSPPVSEKPLPSSPLDSYLGTVPEPCLSQVVQTLICWECIWETLGSGQ